MERGLPARAGRGRRGVEPVIADAHEGIPTGVAKVLRATRQSCRVPSARDVPAHAGRNRRRVVAAPIATAFARNDADAAALRWREVADRLRPTLPRLAARVDEAGTDGVAGTTVAAARRVTRRSVDPRERRDGGIRRRTAEVGSVPDEAAMTRPVGAPPREASDRWALRRARSTTLRDDGRARRDHHRRPAGPGRPTDPALPDTAPPDTAHPTPGGTIRRRGGRFARSAWSRRGGRPGADRAGEGPGGIGASPALPAGLEPAVAGVREGWPA